MEKKYALFIVFIIIFYGFFSISQDPSLPQTHKYIHIFT